MAQKNRVGEGERRACCRLGGQGEGRVAGGSSGGGQVGSASASGASGSGRRLEWAFAYCRGPIHVWSRFVVFSHPLPSKGMSL